jgi:hypothetical protein
VSSRPAASSGVQRRGASLVVYRWDLDKTYLRTEFDTVRQLLRVPFERPEDKVDVPGVVELIRALKPCAEIGGRDAKIYFLSASPPQIGKAIRAKLAMDAVPLDGIVFKNQLRYIVRGRFNKLREQVGFKLAELLRSRHALPPHAEEVLFGDDGESDAITYSVYADTIAGRIDLATLRAVLGRVRVDSRVAEEVLTLAQSISPADAVRRIFVNLDRRTPPINFHRLGTRLVPTFNYLQTAAVLHMDGYIDRTAVVRVARSLVEGAGYTGERLANSLADLGRRGHLGRLGEDRIRTQLIQGGLLPPAYREQPRERLRSRARAGVLTLLRRLRGAGPPRGTATPEPVDYEAVLDDWDGLRRLRRLE